MLTSKETQSLLKMLHWFVLGTMRSPIVFRALLNKDRPLSHEQMQILTSEPRSRRVDGTFIVQVMPENAISGKIKWERWSERKISIFYEHFPPLPLGFLWLSASNCIPFSVIPFSKNVIRRSPLSCSLPVWAQWQSYIIKILTFFPTRLRLTHLPLLSHWCPEKSHLWAALSIHVTGYYLSVCFSVGLAVHSFVIVFYAEKVKSQALCSCQQHSALH